MTTDRVIMRPDLVRVSVPGVSVWTATWDQLLFTTERSGINFFLEGTIAVPNGNGSSEQRGTVDIWYGRSFGALPWHQIMCGLQNASTWSPCFGLGNGSDGSNLDTSWGFTRGNGIDFSEPNYPDRLRISWRVGKTARPNGPIRYRITDLPMS